MSFLGNGQLGSRDKLGLTHPGQSLELSQPKFESNLIMRYTIDILLGATANYGGLQHIVQFSELNRSTEIFRRSKLRRYIGGGGAETRKYRIKKGLKEVRHY